MMKLLPNHDQVHTYVLSDMAFGEYPNSFFGLLCNNNIIPFLV